MKSQITEKAVFPDYEFPEHSGRKFGFSKFQEKIH